VSAPPLISVDFASRRRRLTLAGTLLLLAGATAVAAACLEYRRVEASRTGLELKLAAANRRTHRDPAQDVRNAAQGEEADQVALELGRPWTQLLAELEAASHDAAGEVALLSIEPDEVKHHVRITGESRDLPGVLAYVERLQANAQLDYPMLESHDVRSDDPQHPVRFVIGADWRPLP